MWDGRRPLVAATKTHNRSTAAMSELRLTRRGFSRIGALAAAWSAAASPSPADAAGSPGDAQPFSFERLIERTKQLATQPYVAPPGLPDWLSAIPYEVWRTITFKPEQAVWADSPSYQLQFFFPGSFYKSPVRIYVVDGGTAREIRFSPDMFDLTPAEEPPGFSGESGLRRLQCSLPLGQAERLPGASGVSGSQLLQGRRPRYPLWSLGARPGTEHGSRQARGISRIFASSGFSARASPSTRSPSMRCSTARA